MNHTRSKLVIGLNCMNNRNCRKSLLPNTTWTILASRQCWSPIIVVVWYYGEPLIGRWIQLLEVPLPPIHLRKTVLQDITFRRFPMHEDVDWDVEQKTGTVDVVENATLKNQQQRRTNCNDLNFSLAFHYFHQIQARSSSSKEVSGNWSVSRKNAGAIKHSQTKDQKLFELTHLFFTLLKKI